jgi:hypothetical protein
MMWGCLVWRSPRRGSLKRGRQVTRGFPAFAKATVGGRRWLTYVTASRFGYSSTVRFSVILLLLTSVPVHPIAEFSPGGSRSAGMGDAYVGWAAGAEGLLWNPGSVATGTTISAMVGYDRPFEIEELETVSVASILRFGRMGIGLQHQGLQASALVESVNGMTLGLRVKEVGGGLRLRYISSQVEGRRSRNWTVYDLGILIRSTAGISVGLVGLNVTGKSTGILGQGGMVGLAVTREATTVTVDVQKEAGTATGGAAGVEYRLSELARIRLGIGGHPERLIMGFGVKGIGAEIDYGILYHTVLGLSHRLSLSYSR